MNLDLHTDPDLFWNSVIFTSRQTGFAPLLIEKDYMCSVLLNHLARTGDDSLMFKGGTCLAKVHWNFNRLSEDLDYVIPLPIDAKRQERSKQATPYKKVISNLPEAHPVFIVKEPLTGRNESRQYLAEVGYQSIVSGNDESIKLEIGLREPLFQDVFEGQAKTLLQNAANPGDTITAFPMRCLSYEEAMAEKFRAALSRKDVAIRDFFDIDYAVVVGGLKTDKPGFVQMVGRKLAIPGNEPLDMSGERLSALAGQLNAQLKPVLRPKDFEAFDLERATSFVRTMQTLL